MIRVWIGGDGWVDDDWMGWSLRGGLEADDCGVEVEERFG